MNLIATYPYSLAAALMAIGLFVIIANDHLVKKIIGLNIFQTSVFMIYIIAGKIIGGTPPILSPNVPDNVPYSNPVPHVLILTAIVVGVATTALALAIAARIQHAYNSVEDAHLHEVDLQASSQNTPSQNT